MEAAMFLPKPGKDKQQYTLTQMDLYGRIYKFISNLKPKHLKMTNMGNKKNLEMWFVEKLFLWLFPYTFSKGSEPKDCFK